jgi:hypothetical protein
MKFIPDGIWGKVLAGVAATGVGVLLAIIVTALRRRT